MQARLISLSKKERASGPGRLANVFITAALCVGDRPCIAVRTYLVGALERGLDGGHGGRGG
jgi:hypothetical protein